MKRLLTMTVAVVLVVAAASAAQAQVGRPPVQPFSRPAVPSILNLVNRGNPAINYYGIVRPQQQTTQSLQQLQNQLDSNVANPYATNQNDTGVVGFYQTHWAYFQNQPLPIASLQTAGFVGGGFGGGGGGGVGSYGGGLRSAGGVGVGIGSGSRGGAVIGVVPSLNRR